MSKVLIIGATSAIAQSFARILAKTQSEFYLVARSPEKLAAQAADLKVRGASRVHVFATDLNHFEHHKTFINEAKEFLGEIDTVLIAHGTLDNDLVAQENYEAAESIIRLNFLSPVSILTNLAPVLIDQKKGRIIVISSVAGDRGRQSNYIYGSAKSALSTYLSGLRNRLAKQGVAVMTVKPGFVDTPMTKDFKKGLLWVTPDKVAKGIVKAVQRKQDVVYLPFFWQWIMLVIRCVPEKIFKRLSL